jgi:serine/threonine protein kinase
LFSLILLYCIVQLDFTVLFCSDPQRARGYDVRSDVWSLGITLIELATGRFPYPKWNSVFEQLTQVF